MKIRLREFCRQGASRCRFDDQPDEQIVRVRVRVPRAGRERSFVGEGDAHKGLRRPVIVEIPGQVRLEDSRVLIELGYAARVVQELTDRDLVAAGDETWQPAFNGVAERQLPLPGQLEHDRRHVGLGEAPGPKAVERHASANLP